MRPLAEAKGMHFKVSVPDQDIPFLTDRRALSQILINLVNNAIKFTDQGEVLWIDLSEHHEDGCRTIHINASDTGVGIKEEDQAKLFGAFSQLDSISTQRFEGSGLGLYLSQKKNSCMPRLCPPMCSRMKSNIGLPRRKRRKDGDNLDR